MVDTDGSEKTLIVHIAGGEDEEERYGILPITKEVSEAIFNLGKAYKLLVRCNMRSFRVGSVESVLALQGYMSASLSPPDWLPAFGELVVVDNSKLDDVKFVEVDELLLYPVATEHGIRWEGQDDDGHFVDTAALEWRSQLLSGVT